MTTGVADGQARPLDPRYVDFQKHVGWITSAVLAGIGAVAAPLWFLFARPQPGTLLIVATIMVVLLGLLTWLMQAWPAVEYRYASYRVDQLGLEIRQGVYWRSVITVPRSRVQHTDVSQGPVERRYGLGTLAVHTAGTEHARVELSGLDHDAALAIRDHLLPRDLVDAV